MTCPTCLEYIGRDWVEGECIEPNLAFECPHCDEQLRYKIDEGTYYGRPTSNS